MNYREESLKQHEKWRGKIEVVPRVAVDTREALSLAYTPGVAESCMAIHDDPEKSFTLTRRWNTVPVITDGTAVLGLGDIGPESGMPVMEGKCALFKAFGDVDAFPLCLRTKDTEEIIKTIKLLCVALVLVFACGFSAMCFDTAGFSVKISDFTLTQDMTYAYNNGEINGKQFVMSGQGPLPAA